MSLLALQQAVIATTGGIHDFGLIIAGIIILAIGIILNAVVPNRYWIVLVIIGIIIAVVGVFVLLFGNPFFLVGIQTMLP